MPGPLGGDHEAGPIAPFDASELTAANLRGLRDLLGARIPVAPDGSVLSRLSLNAWEAGLVESRPIPQVIHQTVGAAAFVTGFECPVDMPIRVRSASLAVYAAGPAGNPQIAPELGIYVVGGQVDPLALVSGADTPIAQTRYEAPCIAHSLMGGTTPKICLYTGDGIILTPGDVLLGAGDGTAANDVAVMTILFEKTATECRPPR